MNIEIQEVRQKPRVLDFITIDSLQRLTGCVPRRFVTFTIKEFLDNALDKINVENIEVGVLPVYDSLIVYVAPILFRG